MFHAYIRTECFGNLTSDGHLEMLKQKRTERLDNIFRTYFGWLPLPIALIAFTFTTIYVVAVCWLLKRRSVSRKCYALLLNRTIGDILCCISALVACFYVFIAKHVNRDIIGIIEILFIGSFWSAMVSYSSLSILKLYAIWKPLSYRKTITMKRCLYLVTLSWIIFMIMVTYAFVILALVEVPVLNEWSGCRYETCLRIMHRSRNVIALFIYSLTLIIFAITVVIIKRAEKFRNSFKGIERRSRFPLWKLTLNVGTFGGLSFFYVLWCFGLLLHQDHCFFIRNYVELMRLLGIVRCSLLVRVVVDPMISVISDYQVRFVSRLSDSAQAKNCCHSFRFIELSFQPIIVNSFGMYVVPTSPHTPHMAFLFYNMNGVEIAPKHAAAYVI